MDVAANLPTISNETDDQLGGIKNVDLGDFPVISQKNLVVSLISSRTNKQVSLEWRPGLGGQVLERDVSSQHGLCTLYPLKNGILFTLK